MKMSECTSQSVSQVPVDAGAGAPAASRRRVIGWLIRGDETYGVRRGTLSLLNGLRRHGWNSRIVALREAETTGMCREAGFDVRCIDAQLFARPEGSTLRKGIYHIMQMARTRCAVKRAIRALDDAAPDAIHFRWHDLTTIAGQTAAHFGVPAFWHMPTGVRGGAKSLSAKFYRWQCNRYGILPLANSFWAASTLAGGRFNPEVLYLGVDEWCFDPTCDAISREQLGISADAVVLGVFARLVPAKGQNRILEAMLSLIDESPRLHLLLVGGEMDSPFAREISAVAAAAGASDRLHITGMVDDPQRYYASVDIAVNACIGPESFGLSVVEAMMMRKPVLVHASGGPAETVVDGVTGWHVPEPTVRAFADGIRRALGDRSRWAQMGLHARRRSLENYSIETMIKNYVRLVERVLAGRSQERNKHIDN